MERDGPEQTATMDHEVCVSDLALSAFLLTRGVQLRGITGPPGRREFRFQPLSAEALDTLIQDFYNGTALVPARDLLRALRELRGLLEQPFGGPRREQIKSRFDRNRRNQNVGTRVVREGTSKVAATT